MHPFFKSDKMHGNVVFNFRGSAINDLNAFAIGYHAAGKLLADSMASAPGYRDYDGYPILYLFYLYRHSLELHLKAIVYRGAQLLGLISDEQIDTRSLLTRHELRRLLPTIQAIFKRMEWDWDFEVSGLRSWDDFCTLIREIERIDPQSYSFRYPVTKQGDAALPHHFIVNVISFARSMDPVLDLLNGAMTGLEERWHGEAEVAYFLQELFRNPASEA